MKDFGPDRLTSSPPLRPFDIVRLAGRESAAGKWLASRGRAAIDSGALAFCLLAGRTDGRMFGLLDDRLAASAAFDYSVPLWIMTNDMTDAAIRWALQERGHAHVETFRQGTSYRLTPEGDLFLDSAGNPSAYSTGDGDLVDALRRSWLLDEFMARGGKYLWITDIENAGASIDPTILGAFETSNADVLVEVCPKRPGAIAVSNTNTYLVRAEALRYHAFRWNWLETRKTIDGRPAVQFERSLGDITSVLNCVYVEVAQDRRAPKPLERAA